MKAIDGISRLAKRVGGCALASALLGIGASALAACPNPNPNPNASLRGVSDFNGDCLSDILWRNTGTGDNAIWQMAGITLASGALIPAVADPQWSIAGSGDFNGDGKSDILWRNMSSGDNAIWLMDGFNPGTSALIASVSAAGWAIAGVGDFDGDGRSDILWRNAGSGDNAIWLMDGLATSAAALIPSVSAPGWSIVGVGDFNGDGRSDIAWRNASTGEDAIWLMNGLALASGALIPAVTDPDWTIAGAGDFNGDGKADILWRNTSSGDNAIWLMDGFNPSATALITAATVSWAIVGIGDYDGDGKADVLWRHSDGNNAVWLLNGFATAASALIPSAPTSWRAHPVQGPIVRFAALGATGKDNQGQYDISAALGAKCAASGCDFIQLLGDNIFDSGVTSTSDVQWQSKFEVPYAQIGLPFFAVLGNHDYGGNGSGTEFAKGQFQVDYTAVSPSQKWKMPATYYSRRVNHVEFFALDSNLQMHAMDAAQRTDVAAWLAASTATWKIALGHHAYRSNGPHGNAGSYDGLPFIPITNGARIKTFMDTIVCGRADLHLSAHDYSLQWLQTTCAGTELILSGAGASTTTLPGSNPFHFQSIELGFVYVVIEGNRLTAEFIGATGAVLYSRTITKP